MAFSATSLSVASSSSIHTWKYDVFLSFRGEDTRRSFTDHLHRALSRYGINTFIDDQLRRGEQISSELIRAIEESRFAIIIFSQHYASSSWCLDELVKILECVEFRGCKALPVFYNVDPSDVRNQRGSYGEAFAKHEQVYKDNLENVLKWRKALTVASELSGWDSRWRHESEVIQEIVSKIRNESMDVSSSHMEGLVGMDSWMQKMDSFLCLDSDDVQMIGLWGMAGIGKTTIAKVVYQRFYTQFEGCCFLSNVREKSQKGDLTDLQMELLSQILGEANQNTRIFNGGIHFIKKVLCSMKVLIVLDDVNHWKQLEALAGNHDWFGSGSRIVITTRDKHYLTERKVDQIHEVEELDWDKALMLFCQYAFKQKSPTEDFVQLCYNALNYTKGIPLALKVLGSFLYSRSKAEWDSELEKLCVFPNKEIQDVLRISFDGLDDNEKYIFLDIACFYKGQDKDDISKILESCDFFPGIGLSVLIEKSLITISDNKLCMHDLIQEMGWEIVRQESIKNPGRRSRLWVDEDVIHVLTTNTGTEAVEGIVLDLSALKDQLHFSVDVFTKMNKLRVLSLSFRCYERVWRYSGQYTNLCAKCKLRLSGDFKFLSNNLRYLCWHGYPLKSLPSKFHPEKLVELDMRFSRLEQLWEGNKPFPKLESIILCHSQHIIKTPDFSGAPKLSRIILEDCTSLVKVHPSIGALKNLTVINLRGCKNLKSFWSSIHMESLQILNLSGCSKLKKFPEVKVNMDHLSRLCLEGTAIKRLPLSIEYLNGLVFLTLDECKSLESLPRCIFKLKSLKTLFLSNCLRLKKLPEIEENVKSLKELLLDGTGLRELPSSIEHLNGLVWLHLEKCKDLASLPGSICKLPSLKFLTLSGCSKLQKLPDDIGALQCLEVLEANRSGVQEVPTSITHLSKLGYLLLAGSKEGKSKSRTPVLSLSFGSSPREGILLRLPSLSSLSLPCDLSYLSSLACLDLSRNSFTTLPDSLSRLPQLQILKLDHCKNLQLLPEPPSSIVSLWADGCTSLKAFPFPSNAYKARKLRKIDFRFSNCFPLVENEQSVSAEAILLGIRHVASASKFMNSYYYRDVGHYDIVIPGSRIPDWFSHKNVGCSVYVELQPPDWHDNYTPKGYAVCVVLSLDESGCCIISDGNNTSKTTDHTWFAYRPMSGVEHTAEYLEIFCEGGEAVKQCGVRVIYKYDLMDNASFLLPPCGRRDWEKEMNQIPKPNTRLSGASPPVC